MSFKNIIFFPKSNIWAVQQKNMIISDFLYIDAGSGSALIATILGVAVGATMYIRTKWQSIRYRNKIDK